ncbi:MAG: DUF1566 domain-containing protein, partial [Bacteroidetes bacterium]|nr:DUF1566 domain-containing protein [Bacteroidota bacterium]
MNVLPNWYWSSTTETTNIGVAFNVNMSASVIGGSTKSVGRTSMWPVRTGIVKGTVELPKIGQLVSYAIGDDGSRQQGVIWPNQRFTDNGDGTVKDNLTGLIWLKDAGCFPRSNWPNSFSVTNNLASGSCGLSDNSVAGSWRLPNRKELISLLDRSQNFPALPQGHPFSNVQEGRYWSSSTLAPNTVGAWIIDISKSFVDVGTKSSPGSSPEFIWPIRRVLSPALASIEPNSGITGQIVNITLTGENFTSSMSINVSGTGINISDVNMVSTTSATAIFNIDSTSTPGTRTVSVSNEAGSSNTVDFTVLTPVIAAFSADPTIGTFPLTVNFTDQSTGAINRWSWDFGDGSVDTQKNPVHIYNSAGIFTVSLTVAGDGGTDTETKTEFITVIVPVIIATPNPTSTPTPIPTITLTPIPTSTAIPIPTPTRTPV